MENCKEAEETGEEPQFTAPASYDSVGPLSLAVKVTCGLAPCPSLHPTFNLSQVLKGLSWAESCSVPRGHWSSLAQGLPALSPEPLSLQACQVLVCPIQQRTVEHWDLGQGPLPEGNFLGLHPPLHVTEYVLQAGPGCLLPNFS